MSVITADKASKPVVEKKISDNEKSEVVTATFTVKSNAGAVGSEALAFPAVVTLKIVPNGATYGAVDAGATPPVGVDYSNFTAQYSTNGGTAWLDFGSGNFVPNDSDEDGTVSATVTLPFYTTNIKLGATVHADTLVENAESFQFVISQAEPSLSLSGSTFVSTIMRLSDPVVTAASIAINTDPSESRFNTSSLAENKEAGDTSNAAVASFKLSTALQVASEIQVSIVGNGTAEGDYSGFKYSWHNATNGDAGSGAIDVPINGRIVLPIDTIFFRLATTLKNDGISETGESITFVVKQSDTAVGLKDSSYVQKTFNLIDGPQTFTSLVGSVESFVGTSAIDTFVVGAGKSVLASNEYDVITGFSSSGGDVIKLGGEFAPADIRVLTVNNLDEASIVSILNGLDGTDLSFNSFTFVFKTGSDAYVLHDANRNGVINAATDTFIKLVGGASFDYNNGTSGPLTNDFAV